MAKIKTAFFCQNCGYESVKWLGQCPSCNQWNTFVEELIQKEDSNNNGWKNYNADKRPNKTIALNEIKGGEENRLVTSDTELNRVLGGGIVSGSIVLIAGEPGIGKSTLFLQIGLALKNLNPDLIIVDSIQTIQTPFIDSSPGSVSQIKESAAEFQRFAKDTNTPVFLIGHITKDGTIAGPKILEHMVDTVLQFEGDRHYAYRILRTLKNRF